MQGRGPLTTLRGQGLALSLEGSDGRDKVNNQRESGLPEIKDSLRRSLRRERMRKRGKCVKRKQMPALLCHMVYACLCGRVCVLLHACECSYLLAVCFCYCGNTTGYLVFELALNITALFIPRPLNPLFIHK